MAIWPVMTASGPCLASYQSGSRTLRCSVSTTAGSLQ
jgi:hypothetical protein